VTLWLGEIQTPAATAKKHAPDAATSTSLGCSLGTQLGWLMPSGRNRLDGALA
jgi:hypothetical protein